MSSLAWPFPIYLVSALRIMRLQAAWVVSLLIWASLRFLFTTDIHVIRGLPRPRGLVSMSSTFLVMWSISITEYKSEDPQITEVSNMQ